MQPCDYQFNSHLEYFQHHTHFSSLSCINILPSLPDSGNLISVLPFLCLPEGHINDGRQCCVWLFFFFFFFFFSHWAEFNIFRAGTVIPLFMQGVFLNFLFLSFSCAGSSSLCSLFCSCWGVDYSLGWLLLLQSRGSRVGGLSSCGSGRRVVLSSTGSVVVGGCWGGV